MIVKIDVDTEQGGMYNILKVLVIQNLNGHGNIYSTKEISSITGLCERSIRRSLNNLVSIGFLKKVEMKDENNKWKIIRYEINGDEVLEFVRKNLYS